MTVKDFMSNVFETKVTIFSRGKIFDGSVCAVMPREKNWTPYADFSIVEIEAVKHGENAEIYLIIE